MITLPRRDVREEEAGEGTKEPSAWKACMCGKLMEWGTCPRRNLKTVKEPTNMGHHTLPNNLKTMA